jgi:putative addiction module killer protein
MDGHFGMVRKLDKNLAEFKWKNGLRVYFTLIRYQEDRMILLLLGGNKNSQDWDIKKAKSIIKHLGEKD